MEEFLAKKIEDYTTKQIETVTDSTLEVSIDLLNTIKVLTNVIEDYQNKFENLSIEKIDNLTKIEELSKTIKLQDDKILSLTHENNSISKIDLLIKLKDNIKNQQIQIDNEQNDINHQINNEQTENIMQHDINNQIVNQQNGNDIQINRAIPIRKHPFRKF